MSMEFTHASLWCAIINYGILMVWFLVYVFARDWIYRLHGRWFHLSNEQFDSLQYVWMGNFKIGIFLFNLIPIIVFSMIT